MEIIGVVKNFRYESAAKIIQPLILTAYSEDFRTIMVRLVPGSDFGRTMKKIEDALKSFDSGYIMNARATSDIYRQYYADEDRLKKLVTFGSAVSLVIVIMGIFLLVSQNIALRTKEIGIRKVLGSTTAGMIALMYSNSFKWTLISAIIAIPAGYVYLNNWLQNYAEKASMSWWIFVSGFVIVLSMEILVTFAHIWREVTRNPVESLRYE